MGKRDERGQEVVDEKEFNREEVGAESRVSSNFLYLSCEAIKAVEGGRCQERVCGKRERVDVFIKFFNVSRPISSHVQTDKASNF